MNIDEFRAQYPEYNDLSDKELTKSLHSKYYSDLDFDEFAEKFSGGKKKEHAAFPEDTWTDLGKKLVENAPAMLKQSVGGITRGLAEQAPTPLDIPTNPMTGAPLPGSPWTGKREQQAIDALRDKGIELYKTAAQDLAENAPNVEPESLKSYAYDVSQAVIQMIPAVTASLITKSPVAGGVVIGGQVGGQKYGESRESGRTKEQAMGDAVFYAAAEGLPEFVPLGVLMKPGKKFLPKVLKTAGAESLQEMFTEVLQSGYDKGVLNEEMTWGEVLNRIKRAGITGFFTGGAIATPVAAAESISNRGAKEEVTTQERREDPEKRERVDTLKQRIDDLGVKVARGEATQDELMATVRELHSELTTDSLTGLKNERAFAESEKKPAQASIDLDGLKWINDNMGHPKGDEMFQQVGAAFREAFGDQVFRKNTGGDEFIAQGNDQAALKETLEAVQDRLSRSTLKVTLENGDVVTKQGIEFSFVVDETYEKADARLKSEKESRAEAGKRAGRGEQPPGVVIQPAEQAGETGVTDPAEVGKTIPADQLDELMAEEKVPREALPQDLLAERETGKYAGNINLERLATTQDIDRIFTALAPEKQTPISHAQVVAEAKALGLKSNEVLKWTRQNGITLEGVQAARQILVESGQDLIGKAKVAQGGDAKSLIDFKASLERHNAIMARVSGMTAEAGRILNQFNITTEASKGALEAIEEISALGNTKQIAKRMATLDDPAQINKYSKKAYRATTSDVLLEAWINGLLSGPQTHVVNTVSNTFVSWLNNIEYLPAAAIAKLTKGDVTFREAFSRLSGFIPGAIEGTQLASRAFISEEPSDVSTKVEARRHKAISAESLGVTGPLGSVVD